MSNSEFIEMTIATTSISCDLVANIFFEIGCEAVNIIDKNDLLELYNRKETWDYVDDKLFMTGDDIVYVKSGIAKNRLAELSEIVKQKLDFLKANSVFELGSLEIDYKEIEEDDWRYVWRKFYKPIHAGKFVVIPEWIDYELKAGEYPIYIEPGMAFGTGEHETTKNALKLLSEIDLKSKTVADIGTGSGILAIGALRLGAAFAYMYDIDEQCIKTAEQNAAINEATECRIEIADLYNDNLDKVDVVIANITADVLIKLSAAIDKLTKPDGKVILSGILDVTLEQVTTAYAEAGFKVIRQINDGEWYALILARI